MSIRIRLAFLLSTAFAVMSCAPSPDVCPISNEYIRPGVVLNTTTDEPVPFDRLIDDLAGVDVIYVGEIHRRREDHEVQLRILEALHGRTGSASLAMEMFPRWLQPELDRWSGGELTEEEFLEATDWKRVWAYPFDLYAELLQFAKQEGIDVVGLNAPAEVVSKIARGGLDSLAPHDRVRIANELDLNVTAHREAVREEFEQHMKGHIKDFNAFYAAQLAWEETMAETIAARLRRAGAALPVVALIGSGHVRGRLGIPERARRRVNHDYRIVLPIPLNHLSGEDVDPSVADYLWLTPVYDPPKHPMPPPAGNEGQMQA